MDKTEIMSKYTYETPILKIEEVASWWLPIQLKGIEPAVKAQLPALQRGFVWKPQQVERLWDSLVQGFPIGSLLLSPVHKKNTIKGGKGSDGEIEEPTHILLDGQQRVTSIALGFKDIWSSKGNEHWASLWVDLESPKSSDRQFYFRMITKSHPWGYKRSDPSKTIPSSDASKAMAVFRELLDDDSIKPHELPLDKVFPWDAVAPIPVALLILAIQESEGNEGVVGEKLLEKLKVIDLYSSNKDNKAIKARQDQTNKKIQEGINSGGNSDFSNLVQGMLSALRNAEIPAPVLRKYLGGVDSNENKDPVFTLFERINNAGTNLSREEINYSQLKVVWPNAPEVIEKGILADCHIAKPARLVTVLTRLYVIKSGEPFKDFGSFLKENKDDFKRFCENDGPKIVEKTWAFLTEHENGLPKVLAAEVAKRSSDLMLLIMLWISNVNSEQVVSQRSCRERTLGFFTAIVWLSSNAKEIGKCAKRLAKALQKEIEVENNITDFFGSVRFNALFCNKDSLLMPLPEPQDVRDALTSMVLKNMGSGEIWKQDWWDQIKDPEQDIVRYFNEWIYADDMGVAQNLWFKFFKKIYKNRRFLLYSQRSFIKEHFDWFDPILPDQTEDHNRPWDFDHILPHSWTHHSSGRTLTHASRLVKTWVNSNGNFRVWPYELNRSKGNQFLFEKELPTYNLTGKEVIEASFVIDIGAWDSIEELKNGKFMEKNGSKVQQLFITAAVNRTVDIYQEWYEQLHIGELMEKAE
jgi:hypothetical protein